MGRHSNNNLPERVPAPPDIGQILSGSLEGTPAYLREYRERFGRASRKIGRAIGAVALAGAVGTGLFVYGPAALDKAGDWYERAGSAEMGSEYSDIVLDSSEKIADELYTIQTGMAHDPDIKGKTTETVNTINYRHDGNSSGMPEYEVFQAHLDEEGDRTILDAEYRQVQYGDVYSVTEASYDVTDLPAATDVSSALASLAEAPARPPLSVAKYGGVHKLAKGGAAFSFVVIDGELRVRTGAESPGWVSVSSSSDNLDRMAATMKGAADNLEESPYAINQTP